MEHTITLSTEQIKLVALLKLCGVADSGGQAKQLIQEGLVRVNGAPTTQRGKKLRPGDVVEVACQPRTRIVVQ